MSKKNQTMSDMLLDSFIIVHHDPLDVYSTFKPHSLHPFTPPGTVLPRPWTANDFRTLAVFIVVLLFMRQAASVPIRTFLITTFLYFRFRDR